jgi:tetratricopeptide (TPR) repeat protein
MISAIEIPNGGWILRLECPPEIEDQFSSILESFEMDIREAEEPLRTLLEQCPFHIDALNTLSIIFSRTGRELEAYLCLQEAVRLGLDALPRSFSWTSNELSWGHLDNRPFMSSYHNLGLYFAKNGDHHRSSTIFSRLVSVCANDNLGARHMLVTSLLHQGQAQRVIQICRQYSDTFDHWLEFSKIVALCMQHDVNNATAELILAIERHRHVAVELRKSRHTKPEVNATFGVASGSPKEAYEYWFHNRDFWTSDSQAGFLIRELKKQ